MSLFLKTSTDHNLFFHESGASYLLKYGKALAGLDHLIDVDSESRQEEGLMLIRDWQNRIIIFFEVSNPNANLKKFICKRSSETRSVDIRICSLVSYLLHQTISENTDYVYVSCIGNMFTKLDQDHGTALEIRRLIAGILCQENLLKTDKTGDRVGLSDEFMQAILGEAASLKPDSIAALKLAISVKAEKTKSAKKEKKLAEVKMPIPEAQGSIIPARTMLENLRKLVIGQDRQLAQLCSEGYIHCLRRNALLEAEKTGSDHNDIIHMGNRLVVIAGPSGSGKSFAMSNYCRLSGLSYVDYPATQLTAQGYVGASVESPLNMLVEQSGNDMQRARFSILLLDEADKLQSSNSSTTKDIGGSCVQNELLKLCGGGNIELDTTGRKKNENGARIFSTVGLMTVLCGAFSGLEDRVKYLRGKGGVGFGDATVSKRNPVLYDGLLTYFIPELLNRVSLFLMFSPLSVASLIQICHRSTQSYSSLLASQGLPEIEIEANAVRDIAEFCAQGQNPLQARGIKGIVGKLIHEIIMSPPVNTDRKIVFSGCDVTTAIAGFMSMEEQAG